MKKSKEAAAKELIIQLIKDAQTNISEDPKILITLCILFTDAVIASKLISGEEMINMLVTHLMHNDLLHPIKMSMEEISAIQNIPAKKYLN